MEFKTGYKDDPIFLLSLDEYKKYQDLISHKFSCALNTNNETWLRTPNKKKNLADSYIYGPASENGSKIDSFHAVRPAIKFSDSSKKVGDIIIVAKFPWIVIDEGIAIAEVIIDIMPFDYDNNDYENSRIRKRLLEWYMERI